MHLGVSEVPRMLARGMGNLRDRLIGPKNTGETLGLSSIATSLAQNGSSIEQVLSMDCMCYDANDAMNYLAHPDIARLLDESHMDFRLYGKVTSAIQHAASLSIQVYPTSRGLTQHNTLIEMDNGSTLVWHEPRHVGKYAFMDGGYLIDISKKPEVRERLQFEFTQLRQGKELSPDFYHM